MSAVTLSAELPPPQFPNPGDERLHWVRESRHFADGTLPLAGDLLARLAEHGHHLATRRLQAPLTWRVRRHCCWLYEHDGRTAEGEAFDAAMTAARAEVERTAFDLERRWTRLWLPEIRLHLRALSDARTKARLADPTTADSEAVRRWQDALAHAERLWELHFELVFPAGMVRSRFEGLYRELFPDDPPLAAWELVTGFRLASVHDGVRLAALAREAASAEEVSAAIQATSSSDLERRLSDNPAGTRWLASWRRYLADGGERSPRLDLAAPTVAEDPAPALAILRAMLANEHPDPEATRRRLAARRGRRIASVRRHLDGYPRPVRDAFERHLRSAQWGMVVQENHNDLIDRRSIGRVRQLILAIGTRLAAQGRIPGRDDVFYLEEAELASLLAGAGPDPGPLTERIHERRSQMERWLKLTPPETIGASEPADAAAPAADPVGSDGDDPDLLKGVPAGAGHAEGTAFVADTIDDAARVQPGQILVTTTTGQGWTPFFAVIAAIVTETGGALSHAAVVAREYGLPAVVGVRDAKHRIRTGDRVSVDGTSGTVRRLEPRS